MGRPAKNGIDYFPLDTKFDDNIQLFLMEYGAKGLATLIILWQMIYRGEGYYIDYNKDLLLIIKREINIEINEIEEIIKTCFERNIFNKTLFDKYKILTSNGIQKRYFLISKRKKHKKIKKEYLLIDPKEFGLEMGDAYGIDFSKKKKEIYEIAMETFGHTLNPRQTKAIDGWIEKHGQDVVAVILQRIAEKKPKRPFYYASKIFERREEELKKETEVDFEKLSEELNNDTEDIKIPF